jgi:glyoxylase-like metal-dependent hydrolase (beta-lactamase superfamily II)
VSGRWLELADGVFARRYAELDLTVGLVLGAERALVVDTRGDRTQGAELHTAIRGITPLPLTIAITHGHFDHCFGTSAFVSSACATSAFVRPAVPRTPVYAQRGCLAWLSDTAEAQRTEWVRYYRSRATPSAEETADALEATTVVPPDVPVDHASQIDLGGRVAELLHPGPGHTDHDLAVHLPDSGVLFAGDLVEQGAPPDFGDADPLRWPEAVGQLLALCPRLVVPGHGNPVTASFVAGQQAELSEVAGLCRRVMTGELTEPAALVSAPYPASTMQAALARITPP